MNTFQTSSSLKISPIARFAACCVLAIGFGAVFTVFGSAQTQKAAAPTGSAANGKKLFAADGCWECHGTMAQGASTGPRLGPHVVSVADIIRELRHPNEMPPFTEKVISDAEIADIYAFLQTLPEPPKVDTIPLLAKQ